MSIGTTYQHNKVINLYPHLLYCIHCTLCQYVVLTFTGFIILVNCVWVLIVLSYLICWQHVYPTSARFYKEHSHTLFVLSKTWVYPMTMVDFEIFNVFWLNQKIWYWEVRILNHTNLDSVWHVTILQNCQTLYFFARNYVKLHNMDTNKLGTILAHQEQQSDQILSNFWYIYVA